MRARLRARTRARELIQSDMPSTTRLSSIDLTRNHYTNSNMKSLLEVPSHPSMLYHDESHDIHPQPQRGSPSFLDPIMGYYSSTLLFYHRSYVIRPMVFGPNLSKLGSFRTLIWSKKWNANNLKCMPKRLNKWSKKVVKMTTSPRPPHVDPNLVQKMECN